jgi:hypothetical protein
MRIGTELRSEGGAGGGQSDDVMVGDNGRPFELYKYHVNHHYQSSSTTATHLLRRRRSLADTRGLPLHPFINLSTCA